MKHRRKELTFVITTVLIAALVFIYWQGRPRQLIIYDADKGIVYGAFPVTDGSRFNLEFIHSVNKTPVKDELEIRGRNLYPVSTTYSSFGAGVQTELDGDEKLSYNEAGDMVITGFNQKLEQLNLIVGTVSDHLFTIEGQVISLTELCGKNAAVVFRVK